jgi:hypothetical protein
MGDDSHCSANRDGVVFVSSQNGSLHMLKLRGKSPTSLKLLHAHGDSHGLTLAASHRDGALVTSSFRDNTLDAWLLGASTPCAEERMLVGEVLCSLDYALSAYVKLI